MLQGNFNKEQGLEIKSGCYAAGKEVQNPIELPLKSFHYDIEIVDSIAQVKMKQIYYNDKNDTLDVQYIFPIPPEAAISNLQYSINNGKINRAVVIEKQDAQRKYSEGLNEGRGVVYGSIQSNSKDYMKIKIGNVLRKQEIRIQLSFVQKMGLVYNSFYQFRLQSSMTPRYGAKLPANQIMFELPNYKNKQTFQARCVWGIQLRIKSERKLTKVQSFTHKIIQTKVNNNQSKITFAENNMLPNKDFALLYTFQNFQKPSYAICHNDNKSSAVISFIPKFCRQNLGDALNQAKKNKNLNVGLNASKGQYIFLIDRSGSMEGTRIQKAKKSLIIFLKSLPEDSYFNVISFGNKYQYIFKEKKEKNQKQGKSKKYTKQSLEKAINAIQKMTADMGGTQILNPLQNVMTLDEIKGYPRLVFMLTDGAVSNVTSVVKFIKAHTQYSRISSIGIGNGCSRDLIQNAAKKGRGYSTFIDDEQEPSKKIISLLENSLTPIILDMQISFDKSKVESITPNPQKMPYILKNDLANFFITFKGKLTQDFEININYRDSLGFTYTNKVIISPDKGIQCKFISTMVAFEKINALVQTYSLHQASQQRIFFVKQIDMKKLKEQIIKESIENQILTQLTAFVCIDQSYSDEYAKQIAKLQKYQVNLRAMIPHDHVQVKFVQDGVDNDDDSDEYIDECCMNVYEQADQSRIGMKIKKQQIRKYRKLKMFGRNAANPSKPLYINGTTDWPQPQRRLMYQYIVKKQQIDGSWTQNFVESLQNTQMKDKRMYRKYQSLGLQDILIFTIITYGHLKRIYGNFQQYKIIIQKAKNYVITHLKNIQWPQIIKIYKQDYNIVD